MTETVVVRADADLAALRERGTTILFALIAVAFGLLCVRLAVIQAAGHREAATRARTQEARPAWRQGRSLAEVPERASIFDRSGRVLARSYFEHRLHADPWEIDRRGAGPRIVELLPVILEDAGVRCDRRDLCRRLGGPAAVLRDDREVPVRSRLLVPDLDPVAARCVAEAIARARLPGLHLDRALRRANPHAADTAQVVGVVAESADDPRGGIRGRTGIELWLDQSLSGESGRLAALQDALGREFILDEIHSRRPREGVEVVLTIEAPLQTVCREVLAAAASEHDAATSSAVVVGIRTGEILAASTWPGVDPESPRADHRHLRLAALQDTYDPGSAIKPVFISWALEKGAVTPGSVIDCGGADGQQAFGPRLVREFAVNPEPLDLAGVIMRSSNVGAVRIALERLGLAGMYDALAAFGISSAARLPFPALGRAMYTPWSRYVRDLDALRAVGFLRGGEPQHRSVSWTGISFAQGYEMRISAAEMARLYTPFGRRGELIELSLVKAIRGPGWSRTPVPRTRQVLSEDTAEFMRRAMVSVVENPRGTGHKARSDRYTIAAKTGTGEVMGPGIPRQTYYNAWFCGLAPAERPEILVVVVHHRVRRVADHPYTGGAVSGPPAREIIERTLAHLGIDRDREGPPSETR